MTSIALHIDNPHSLMNRFNFKEIYSSARANHTIYTCHTTSGSTPSSSPANARSRYPKQDVTLIYSAGHELSFPPGLYDDISHPTFPVPGDGSSSMPSASNRLRASSRAHVCILDPATHPISRSHLSSFCSKRTQEREKKRKIKPQGGE